MADLTVRNCSNCGAELKFAPGTLNLKCTHCGTENSIPVPVQALTKVPDYIVPLVADEKILRRQVQTFLAEGHMVPDDVLDAAEFTKMEVFYVPAYVFHGSYTATWTASFGYDRQEHYTDYESRTENGITRRVPVTKTKTVTDWRPVNGNDSGNFNFPAYGGATQPPAVAGLVDGMSWSDGKPFDAAFLAGYRAEEFEKTDDQVFTESGNARLNAIIDAGVKTHAQGDRQRDWNWKANFDKSVTSYFVPMGWARYSYGGKEYNYWIDGIDASRNVADKPPVDSKRRWALILGYAPVLALIPVAGLLPKDAPPAGVGIAATAAIAWGLLRHFFIVRHSKARRAATLARKIAEEGNRHELTDKQEKALATAYSDVRPNFLADTSRDRKLIPALIAGLIVVAVIPSLWTSVQKGRERAAAERQAAERQAEAERQAAERRAQQERQEAERRAALEKQEAERQEAERRAAAEGATAPAPGAAAPSPAPSAAPAASAAAAPSAITLDKGHPDRKILLDRVRPMIEKLLNPPVTFEVDAIRRAGDYAYLRVTPIRPTGEPINVQQTNLKDKNAGVLTQMVLKKEGDTWNLVAGAIGTRLDWAAKYCAAPYPKDLTGTCN